MVALMITASFLYLLSPDSLAQKLQFDSDVSAPLKAQVLADLDWMGSIEGAQTTPLHQEIFGPVNGGSYTQWFDKRVFYFGVDSCGGGNAVACVKSKYANKIFVTNQ